MVRPVEKAAFFEPSDNLRTGRKMSPPGDPNEPGRGELSAEEREAFKKRASDLGSRLDQVKAQRSPKLDERARGAAFGQATKIAVELIVGIAVGGLIGRALDSQFGTEPVFLIVFLLLGFAAGLLNVVRSAKLMQAQAEPHQRTAKPVTDEDDDA
jgi:ATP synthase protein I